MWLPNSARWQGPITEWESGWAARQAGGLWGAPLTSKTFAPLTSLCVHNGGLCARVLQVKAQAKYSIIIWCRFWLPGKSRRLFHHKHTHQLNGKLKRNFCCCRSAPSASPYLGSKQTTERRARGWGHNLLRAYSVFLKRQTIDFTASVLIESVSELVSINRKHMSLEAKAAGLDWQAMCVCVWVRCV